VAAVAAGLQLVGMGMQYNAQQQAARAQRAAGEYNGQILEQNATLVEDRTQREERRFRTATRRQMGAIDAAYAASGVQQTGSVVDVVMDSAVTAERDALEIRHAGELEAFGLRNRAEISRLYGSQEAAATQTASTATLLSGTGNVISTLYRTA
jgi:hypothetical protein